MDCEATQFQEWTQRYVATKKEEKQVRSCEGRT